MRRRIFSVGRRALGAAGLVACLLCPAVASAAPAPDQAAAELNVWRTEIGESPMATPTIAALNTGCAHHDNYEFENGDVLSHTETNGNPGFTSDGHEAGLDSVLAEASGGASDAALLPGPVWDSGVFHRAALLEPRLALTGFDATTSGGLTFSCMWVQNQPGDVSPQVIDNSRTTPGLTLYPSPANGAYDVPTRFPAGSESPNPAQETGVPAGATLGWLLNVEINGPWADGQFGSLAYAHDVTATLAADGTSNDVPLVVSQCGSAGCFGGGGTSESGFFDGGFGIFPIQPLAANTTYRVVLTGGTVTDSAAHVDHPIPAGYSWCFSTGATYTVSPDCAAPTTAAEEVVHPGASTAVSVSPPSGSPPGNGGPPTGTVPGTGPGTGSPTGPGTGPPAGPGTGAPGTGSGAHRGRVRRPSVRGTLGGVRDGDPRLVLRLTAARGAPAIRRFTIALPHGLSLAPSRPGVRVSSARHRARVALRLRHGVLTVRLRHPRRHLVLVVRRPALRVSRLLVRAAGRRRPARLTFSIATTAGTSTTHRRLRLRPR